MKKEITVVETLKAVPGKTKELKKALEEIVPLCRAEEGCLQYDLLEPAAGEGKFLVLMRWSDSQDLKRHENSKAVQDFVKKYDGVLYGEAQQTVWKAVN